ncbi:hypothetical protein BJX66DRAFT_186213 [Aspergillus keveii]|uniref:Uncharacterized protein n=1 Tax=Aspergillus keveii TaxID=714993 RepID=A0ABR4G737_9EURO
MTKKRAMANRQQQHCTHGCLILGDHKTSERRDEKERNIKRIPFVERFAECKSCFHEWIRDGI